MSVREILEQHLFGGRTVGRELWELSTERGLISARQVLSRQRSYYQLTHRGASHLGLSEHWARTFGAQSLISNLSLAWFCCMGQLERRRVERDALTEKFGFRVPGGYHCVEKDGKAFRFYRVYVPMPGTRVREVTRTLRDLLSRSLEDKNLKGLIEDRVYGFAALLETEMRAEAVRDRVRFAEAGQPPLAAAAHLRVESVPDFAGTTGLAGATDVFSKKDTEAD
ncbi:MAG: hypothetical protein IPM64_00115 [Phycisphaerales bacterium]|nr:hypothetical protein [Phycisphaerales bacterium]